MYHRDSDLFSLAEIAHLLLDAPQVFSRRFEQLLLFCSLAQKDLSIQATSIRDGLVASGVISKGYSIFGSQAAPTICNVIDGQQRPTQGQLCLWLGVVKGWCESNPEMLGLPRNPFDIVRDPQFDRTIDLEKDFYRLALFGTIDEINDAYEYWKDRNLFEHMISRENGQYQQRDTDTIRALEPHSDQLSQGTQQVRRALRSPELEL